jgi:uncharacterized protein with GYD domain
MIAQFYLADVEPCRMMTNVQSNTNRRNSMATFITNIKFSQQGIKDIVHTTTCRAFTAAEMEKIVAKVHGG